MERLMKMKPLFLLILIISMLSISVCAEELVENIQWADGRIAKGYYSDFSLKAEGDKIMLTTQNDVYIYPADKEECIGIRKLLKEDVTGDGKDEYIFAIQLKGKRYVYPDNTTADLLEAPYAVVVICDKQGDNLDKLFNIIIGENQPDFKLVDVNKDGIKDVLATGFALAHWETLKIASWQNDRYVFLWDKGADAFVVEQSFGINKNGDAQIKVGFPRYIESEGRFDGYNAQEWDIWIWNGKKFINKRKIRK